MKIKTIYGIMLTLLLMGMLTVALNVPSILVNTGPAELLDDSSTIQWAHGDNPSKLTDSQEGFLSEGFNWNGPTRAKENSKPYSFDEDSVELVIGVNYAQPDGYTKVTDLIVENGGKLVNTVSIRDEVIALVADMPLGAVSSFRALMQASDVVRYVEHNMKFQTQFVPNDTYWSWQWGPQVIEADWAWNTTIGDPSILVAVIDTGVDYDHPDLAANYVSLGYDWVNNDNDTIDDNGHGTHVAGTIAAVINNGIGIAGLAQVQIMAEKGLDWGGWGTEDDLANAIIHAVDQGADILSNSWGGYGESLLIYDAVKYAYDKGVLVVAAAGNDAIRSKLYPAAHDEVIAVTATDQLDDPASFTNFGEWVEVAAPGVDIYSTMPTYHVTLNDPPYNRNLNYDYLNGTSMATPHVSGVAALIWSQFPNLKRDWVRAHLTYSADDLGDPDFDDYYGYGRINARNAVELAQPDHDLLIFGWERPSYVKVGELASFNTTVLNFGISDEADVEVQLLANSSLIDSTYIAFLPEGTSTTVGLSWTPAVEGTYNVTSYVVPVPDETITQNNLITEIVTVVAPPPDANWILLATDPDEGVGTSLKAIYGQLYSDIIYFKVEHHRPWTTINDINTAIFIDADQDPSTGLPDGTYPDQNTGIGADYLIVVGWEATEMLTWDPINGWWDLGNPISLAYLYAPDGSNVFVVGVFLADVETAGTIDCAIADIPSDWDWMPDTGYFTWFIECEQHEHELTVFLEAPHHLQPGDSSLLNATVYNIGLNNETNVELQLLINDTLVDSALLPELENGSSHTLSYLWTPTVEGASYNITAYAPSITNETILTNNIATRLAYVLFYTRTYLPNEWIGDGVAMSWHGDDTNLAYSLPFDFPFYGTIYALIYISSNGLITFLNPDSNYTNSRSALAGKLAIAPAWDDWVTYDPYDIFIWHNSTHVGVRWYVCAIDSSIVGNFEAILGIDGVIQFNYQYNDGPVSATIGISNGKGDILAEDVTNLNHINTIVFRFMGLIHDVAVVDVTPHKTVVGKNYSMFINTTVENLGNFTKTFNVTAYYGNATITSQQWETFWSMGDVNKNGTIDIGDFELLNASYGYPLGHPNWCPWADLDRDGDVDRYDAGTYALNIGLDIWTYFISGGVIETQPVNNLPPRSFNTLTLMWNTTGVPYGNYTISAYAVPILCEETERADNNYGDGIVLVSVVGDICGDPDDPHPDARMNPADGDVDRYDYGVFSRVYGLSIGDPDYMPEADFVGDSHDPNPNLPDHDVDRYDYGILAQNYGATVP
jgi:thermitase